MDIRCESGGHYLLRRGMFFRLQDLPICRRDHQSDESVRNLPGLQKSTGDEVQNWRWSTNDCFAVLYNNSGRSGDVPVQKQTVNYQGFALHPHCQQTGFRSGASRIQPMHPTWIRPESNPCIRCAAKKDILLSFLYKSNIHQPWEYLCVGVDGI